MGDIIGSIFGFFGDLGGFLDSIRSIFQWLGNLLSGLGKFLQHVWNILVKKILGGILHAMGSLSDWLEEKLKPILDYLAKLRRMLANYYNTYLRPILMFLQRVRSFLHLLALLHIHIAQRLDSFLGKLQAKIIGGFYTLTAAINTLTQILLALQDPEYLIKHPVLLISIRRQLPMLIRAVTGRPPGYWFPSPKGKSGGTWAPPSFPFNFRDASQNPPASSYVGNDGLPQDLAPMVNCYEYTATSVDEVQPLDYFNDDLYPTTMCPYDDPAKCLLWSWGIQPEGS